VILKSFEFDKKFDNYENPMSLNEFKNKILEKSKQLGLSFEDTIKVLLARELKVI